MRIHQIQTCFTLSAVKIWNAASEEGGKALSYNESACVSIWLAVMVKESQAPSEPFLVPKESKAIG